jgi:hypothetical protein
MDPSDETPMLTAERVLDAYFLETRSMLLEIAATLDRYDAAAAPERQTPGEPDPRLEKIYQALALLSNRGAPADRAEQLLRLFSDPLD